MPHLRLNAPEISMSDTNRFWLFIKISYLFFWLNLLLNIIAFTGEATLPFGIAKLVSLNFLFDSKLKFILVAPALTLAVLYLFEKWMPVTTLLMTALTLLLISHHESTGVFLRATAYSTVIGAQALAYGIKYFKADFDLEKYRIQFPVQIIAATYTLAGLSKLMTSGIEWIDTGKFFSLQILKNQYFFYIDSGSAAMKEIAWQKAEWFNNHLGTVKFFLASSLLLELACFAALVNKKMRAAMGFMLLGMHIGIFYVMGIMIGGVAFNMVIFFLNPLYYIVFFGGTVFRAVHSFFKTN